MLVIFHDNGCSQIIKIILFSATEQLADNFETGVGDSFDGFANGSQNGRDGLFDITSHFLSSINQRLDDGSDDFTGGVETTLNRFANTLTRVDSAVNHLADNFNCEQ